MSEGRANKWNYRLAKKWSPKQPPSHDTYEIVEVYYNEDGEAGSWVDKDECVMKTYRNYYKEGEPPEEQARESLKWVCQKVKEALEKPLVTINLETGSIDDLG